jgi:hypothetical protein
MGNGLRASNRSATQPGEKTGRIVKILISLLASEPISWSFDHRHCHPSPFAI